jgi:hypothetical protein
MYIPADKQKWLMPALLVALLICLGSSFVNYMDEDTVESLDGGVVKVLWLFGVATLLVTLFIFWNGEEKGGLKIANFICASVTGICLLLLPPLDARIDQFKENRNRIEENSISAISKQLAQTQAQINAQSNSLVAIESTPSVSLDIGPALDPKSFFGTSFVIHNDGNEAISNVYAVAYWYDPIIQERTVFAVGKFDGFPRISANRKQGLRFYAATNLPPIEQQTFVNVDVRYTPESFTHETNQTFQFCVISNENTGEFVWTYNGDGESLEDLASKIQQQATNIMNNIPFIIVGITNIQDISSTTPEYPLQISYIWANSGGIPATDVDIEWSAFDEQTGDLHIWVNYNAYSKEILWPGKTAKWESRNYHDPNPPSLYQRIMSGRYTLFGLIRYRDLGYNDYIMRVKIIKKGDFYETRCLSLQTPYGDLSPK